MIKVVIFVVAALAILALADKQIQLPAQRNNGEFATAPVLVKEFTQEEIVVNETEEGREGSDRHTSKSSTYFLNLKLAKKFLVRAN